MSAPGTPASWAVRVSRPGGGWRVELLAADAADELPALERALGDPGAEDWPGPFVVVVDSRLYFVVLRHGPGGLVRALPAAATFDLAFVDADKAGYADYVDRLHPRMTDNGVVLLDNTLRNGRVLDPQNDDDRALVELNAALAADPRWETVLLPLADGLTMLRRR